MVIRIVFLKRGFKSPLILYHERIQAVWLTKVIRKRVVNRPFLSWLSVSKQVFLRNHSYENVFQLQVLFHVNQTYLFYERFCTRTRFETDALGNSEMAFKMTKHYVTAQTWTSGFTLHLCWKDVFISEAVCKFESLTLFGGGIEIVPYFCVNALVWVPYSLAQSCVWRVQNETTEKFNLKLLLD